jgi:phosphoglycerate dehydrogenase-like enzyme
MVVVGLGDIGRTIALSGLTKALAEADFAVVVLPLTDETRGVIGAAALAAMRPTAWLLNIGRGAVIAENALVEALRARRIGGAVLDVFVDEPLPAEHPFWVLPNAVVTPHISGPSTPAEMSPVFNDNLARWLAGRPLRHVVDRRRGY